MTTFMPMCTHTLPRYGDGRVLLDVRRYGQGEPDGLCQWQAGKNQVTGLNVFRTRRVGNLDTTLYTFCYFTLLYCRVIPLYSKIYPCMPFE